MMSWNCSLWPRLLDYSLLHSNPFSPQLASLVLPPPGGSDTGATSLPALVQRAAMVAHGDQSVSRPMAVLSPGLGQSTALCAMFFRSNPNVDLSFPF